MLFYSLDDKTQEKVAGKKKIFKACQCIRHVAW